MWPLLAGLEGGTAGSSVNTAWAIAAWTRIADGSSITVHVCGSLIRTERGLLAQVFEGVLWQAMQHPISQQALMVLGVPILRAYPVLACPAYCCSTGSTPTVEGLHDMCDGGMAVTVLAIPCIHAGRLFLPSEACVECCSLLAVVQGKVWQRACSAWKVNVWQASWGLASLQALISVQQLHQAVVVTACM